MKTLIASAVLALAAPAAFAVPVPGLSQEAAAVIAEVDQTRVRNGRQPLDAATVRAVASDRVGTMSLATLSATDPAAAFRFAETRAFLREIQRDTNTIPPLHYQQSRELYLTRDERLLIGSIMLGLFIPNPGQPSRLA
ncbi:MAG: hypothetical protein SF051_11015 [Elusimicrobiota bacterium]|nr:hypothetical protein [Elusimicrobiota bacterium]